MQLTQQIRKQRAAYNKKSTSHFILSSATSRNPVYDNTHPSSINNTLPNSSLATPRTVARAGTEQHAGNIASGDARFVDKPASQNSSMFVAAVTEKLTGGGTTLKRLVERSTTPVEVKGQSEAAEVSNENDGRDRIDGACCTNDDDNTGDVNPGKSSSGVKKQHSIADSDNKGREYTNSSWGSRLLSHAKDIRDEDSNIISDRSPPVPVPKGDVSSSNADDQNSDRPGLDMLLEMVALSAVQHHGFDLDLRRNSDGYDGPESSGREHVRASLAVLPFSKLN